jgi:hypothetical protein
LDGARDQGAAHRRDVVLDWIPIQVAFDGANPLEHQGMVLMAELHHLNQINSLGISDDFRKGWGQINKGMGLVSQTKAGQCQLQQAVMEERMD